MMGDYYSKKSGQIPAFGDWENANEMPITQYFECARQAGLLRYSSSSTETEIPSYNPHGDLYPSRNLAHPNKTKGREMRGSHSSMQGRVCNATDTPSKTHKNNPTKPQNDVVRRPRNPKPVDEDLYKIPPDLLRSSKRKRVPGFFACLVPCSS